MAYTGTGTEADPYLVSTLSDFLTCAAMADAYVKVTSDIDAADDPGYGGLITDTIQVSCRKLYADAEKKISGIVVQNDYFITIDAGVCDIQNLTFQNCKLKLSGTSGVLILFPIYTPQNQLVYHCNFSMQLSGGAVNSYYISSRPGAKYSNSVSEITYCGFDISSALQSTAILYLANLLGKLECCNFVLRNLIFSGSGSIYLTHATPATNCAVIFDSLTINKNLRIGDENNSSYRWTYCYIALINPTGTSQLDIQSNTGQCYFMLENAPSTFDTNYISNYLLTPEQLRSRDYLISIGFLP